VFAIPNILL